MSIQPLLFLCLVAGLIRLRSSPPPHLQGVEYVLNVTATDDNSSGGPQALSSTAQVIVGVDDVNNNKPVFERVRWTWPHLCHHFFFFQSGSLSCVLSCYSSITIPFFVFLPPLFIRLYLSSLEKWLASLTSHLCSLVSLLHLLTLLIKALRDVTEIPSDLALAA